MSIDIGILRKFAVMKCIQENMPLHAVEVPVSKSISNRLLMLKYSCFPQLRLYGLSNADDTRLLQNLLEKINAVASEGEVVELNVHNCGTAFRFLLPYLSQKKGRWRVVGSERMLYRPIQPLVEVLRAWGAEIILPDSGSFPLEIIGQRLHPTDVSVNICQSSQFLSALLLSLPSMRQDVCLHYDAAAPSVSYLQLTVKLMQEMGMHITDNAGEICFFASSSVLNKTEWTVERDWSSAAFWWAWAALQPSPYRLFIAGLSDTGFQADAVIHRLLSSWGLQSRFTEGGAWVEKTHPLQLPVHFVFDGRNCLDLIPLLTVLCHLLEIPHQFIGVENLKLKESDRVNALQLNLQEASSGPPFHFRSFSDHRIVMAFTLFSVLGKVRFDHPEVVSKSYPCFWEQFR